MLRNLSAPIFSIFTCSAHAERAYSIDFILCLVFFRFFQNASGLHGFRAAPSLKDLAFQFVLLQVLQSNPCCVFVRLSGGRCIMFTVGDNVLGYDFE